jgi:dihydroxyacid dehydratase/phosphogluconate dehydratase
VVIDVDARRLDVEGVDLAARTPAPAGPGPHVRSRVLRKYARQVGPASRGAITSGA